MSQTFLHKGRRVDFDLWMHPDLAQDLDFDILASMAIGTHQNVASFEQDVVRDRFHHVEETNNFQMAVGVALSAWGTVMLIPGPAHVVAARIGWSIAGPIGAGIAVVAYVVFGLIVLGTGAVLIATA